MLVGFCMTALLMAGAFLLINDEKDTTECKKPEVYLFLFPNEKFEEEAHDEIHDEIQSLHQIPPCAFREKNSCEWQWHTKESYQKPNKEKVTNATIHSEEEITSNCKEMVGSVFKKVAAVSVLY